MTVMEHLRELRTRIIISALAFILISVIAFFFYDPIQTFLRTPLCDVPRDRLGPQGCELVFTKPTGGFQFRLKLTALVGLAVTSPIWIYQIYAFIVPALTSKEKRYSIPFLASSILLFLVGTTFAYLTLPVGLRFLIELGGEGLVPLVDAESYLSFVGFLLLAFGLTFELPLLLVFLGLVGAVSVEQLRQHRKTAFVSTFVLAAVVTPSQDPYTMSIMAIPLYLLYELTIIILRTVMRRRGVAQS
nr:twin-arginine translocase subunit TatC [Actinomycetota bacterium]